jgi:hypothetical protein
MLNLTLKKSLVVTISIIGAIILPYFIVLFFHVIFPDFYTKGFLTGLGHMMIGGIMIFLNLIIGPNVVLLYYKDMVNDKKTPESFYKAILILILVSVAVQVTLNILIENPFKDPPRSFM